jgi:hypothetical protein
MTEPCQQEERIKHIEAKVDVITEKIEEIRPSRDIPLFVPTFSNHRIVVVVSSKRLREPPLWQIILCFCSRVESTFRKSMLIGYIRNHFAKVQQHSCICIQ